MTAPSPPPSGPAAGTGALHDLGGGRYRDATTGLVLVAAPDKPLYRVFEGDYSPLDAPVRSGDNPEKWNRWDLEDTATLYGAQSETGAVLEVLGSLKPAELKLEDIFDDIEPGTDAVAEDWGAMGHSARGHVDAEWREKRHLTAIRIRPGHAGWFVDLGHAKTIAALRRAVASWTDDGPLVADPTKVDLGLLWGERREVTTAVAAWLQARVLADGSTPSGIRYVSRHGQDFVCWAVWVPLLRGENTQRVRELVASLVSADQSRPLLEDTPALLEAARLLGVRVH